jgi:hypothetical protein
MRAPERVSQCLLLALSSDRDGESLAAIRAVRKALDGAKISIHDFTDAIKSQTAGTSTKQDIDDAYQRGRLDERKAQEASMQRSPSSGVTLAAMAQFLAEHIHELDFRHHEFIQNMISLTSRRRRLSERQQQYLEDLFYQHADQGY